MAVIRFRIYMGILMLPGCLCFPVFAAEPTAPEPLVQISQTFGLVNSNIIQSVPVHLSGTVYGVDKTHHGLVLRDKTGWLWLETESWPENLEAGAEVRLEGPVVFGENRAVLGGATLLETKASQGPGGKVARLHLSAGKHAFQIDFFNATRVKPILRLRYAGSDFTRTNVPATMLWHTDTNAPGQFLPGVHYDFYRYDAGGLWDEFPDFDRLVPVKSGVTNYFVAASAEPTNCVAYRYSGYLEIAREDDYEFSLQGTDGARLAITPEVQGKIEVTGATDLTAPLTTEPGQDWDDLAEPAWIQTEGTVRQAGLFNGRLQLELASETGRMLVSVSDGDALAAAMLLDSQVKVTGLGWSVNTPQSDKVAGMLLAPDMAQVVVLQAPPERWQEHPVRAISSVGGGSATNTPNRLVHLRGTVTGVVPGKALQVRDETGEIEVRTGLAQANDQGLVVELLGQLDWEASHAVLRFAAIRRGPDFQDAKKPLPLLTSIEQIRRLTMAEATRHYPVKFKGIVTFVFYGGVQAHVQGETEGITVVAKSKTALELHPGDVYEFEGITEKGLMSPTVVCQRYQEQGRGQWPEPMRPAWRQLSNGSLDAQWAEVQGVVLSAKSLNLVLGLYGGEVTARIYQADPDELKNLIGSVVRVRGSVTLANNQKRRAENISLEVNSRFDVAVVVPAPVDPFVLPAISISNLFSFDPATTPLRPVKISGLVLHTRRNILYLTDGQNGLRITPRQQVHVSPGDQVDVLGIPDNDGALTTIKQASVRQTGLAPLPRPILWTPEKAVTNLNDSSWVQVEGIVLNNNHDPTNQILELQIGPATIAAELNVQLGRLPEVPLQSRVQVTGVYLAQTTSDLSRRIMMNSADALVVLSRPSWFTWRHSLLVLGLMGLALVGTFAWITALRRRVERSTRELRGEIEERRRAQLEVEETHRQLVDASRRAGQAEIAANVLHSVGNVLNSVNVSTNCLTDRISRMHIASVSRTAELLHKHGEDLPRFLVADEKGRRLPHFLTQLGQQLSQEQRHLLNELGELKQNVEHINGIIATQQAISKRFGVWENLAISEVVDMALRFQANTNQQRSIEIVRDYENVPPVLTDKHTILTILVNLLQNAQHACEEGRPARKRISIRIRREGQTGVSIEVADNGIGIAPESLTSIFGHGFATRKDGHGFGLHSGALAAQEIGGQLKAQSDGLGKGAAFTLILPLRPPEKSEAAEKKPAAVT